MRTTIRLDDALLRRAKTAAASRGVSLNDLIQDAVRAALAPRPLSARVGEGELPVYGGFGLLPGVSLDDSAALLDILEERDARGRGG